MSEVDLADRARYLRKRDKRLPQMRAYYYKNKKRILRKQKQLRNKRKTVAEFLW